MGGAGYLLFRRANFVRLRFHEGLHEGSIEAAKSKEVEESGLCEKVM